MWEGEQSRAAGGRDPWLVALLVLSTVLNSWHLTWGLPNGNASWAADAIGPVTALGVARRTFDGWNSGWFYFKYPPGWPFLMVAVSLPYLGYLYLTGGWSRPSAEYPYGFADPERALFVLSMLARLLSVAFGVGLTALAYAIGRQLFDRTTARLSAAFAATSYPLVYYAHTTNLDISYCFWVILALYAAIVASRTAQPLPAAVLGAAAAMALSTKEQGFAWLLPLPVLVWAAWIRARGWRAVWTRATGAMLGAGLLTLLIANNALVNPLGFIGRIAYLLGHPLMPVEARLAPVEFALWKGTREWVYAEQLWVGLDSSLGLPLLLAALAGAVLAWRRPQAAVWLLTPVLLHYYLSLRGLELITLRYLLPVTFVGCVLVAAASAALWEAARRPLARAAAGAAIAGLVLWSLARAVELDWLLTSDARYQAEAWMAAHLPAGARVEVYQKAAFVPRLDGFAGGYVPIGERSLAGLTARQPDAIVTSSASHKSITHTWAADWRETRNMLAPAPPAIEMLTALESGALPYRLAASFRQEPRTIRNRITSIAPEIRIYVRVP